MKPLRAVASTIAALWALSPLGSAQSIMVQVLNGKNGKPVREGTAVRIVFANSPDRRTLGLHTDRQGEVEFDAEGAKDFQISATGYAACKEQRAATAPTNYSVDEILDTGSRSGNHCGQAYPETQPGRLLYFVKPEAGW